MKRACVFAFVVFALFVYSRLAFWLLQAPDDYSQIAGFFLVIFLCGAAIWGTGWVFRKVRNYAHTHGGLG